MVSRITARGLLHEARTLYDNPALPFAKAAENDAWRSGFVSGAEWMRLALCQLRGQLPVGNADFQRLGFVKYGLASIVALIVLVCIWLTQMWLLLPSVVIAFYVVEAQMVFLFPLALDNAKYPLRASWNWTRIAGGTIPVMLIVMRLAMVMLFGGFLGGGFIRSWCLGCLSVVLWYEKLRNGMFDGLP